VDGLHNHGLCGNPSCALCVRGTETLDHMLAGCVFHRELWFQLLRKWQQLTSELNSAFIAWWLHSWKLVAKECGKIFDSVILLGA
jgi:hypothetical protein